MDLTLPPLTPMASLVIRPFQEGLATTSSPTRYLVDSGTRQHVVGTDAHKLLLALQGNPPTWEALSAHYSALIGTAVSTAEVHQAAAQLPIEWFKAEEALPVRTPFWFHVELLSAKLLGPLTARLSGLFNWWLAVPVVLSFLVVQTLVLPTAVERIHVSHNAAENILLLLCLLTTTLIHELGHLSACARSGGKHGGIGFGMYWVFPAFYADVTKAWHLAPRARVLVDAGGIYFQSFTIIAIGAYALATDSSFAYRLIWLATFMMLHTLNPFFKFDGYWLLSDATGLTNLHAKVRQAVVDTIRRIFKPSSGRAPASNSPLKSTILYVYAVLCGIYLLFVFNFLYREAKLIVQGYPGTLAAKTDILLDALSANQMGGALLAVGELLLASAWPACLLLASIAMIGSLASRCSKVIADLQSGAKTTSAGGAA